LIGQEDLSELSPLERQEALDRAAREETITEEDVKSAVGDHAEERARAIRAKYGPEIDYETLLTILEDRECVRYPVTIEFDSGRLEPGMFACAELVPEEISEEEAEWRDGYEESCDEYVIVVHEAFKERRDVLPALILYHLVVVNYGDFATAADAEVFGSTVLGLDREEYYSLLCDLTDQL